MKFHQLPVGARFGFRDATYRKISPLKGSNEADETQKLIPRSAEVSRLGEGDIAAPVLPDRLTGGLVEAAAWGMVERCSRALTHVDPALTPDQQDQVTAALEAATQEMLAALAAG